MIGLDISEKSVKVVQLDDDPNIPNRLLSRCWHAIENGVIERGIIIEPNILQQIVLKTFEQCSIKPNTKDAIVASIPETQSFLRVIEIPEMSEDEIDEAVKWEVAQHIPFGLENVNIDWQPVVSGHQPPEGQIEVLVGAAQKKVVEPLMTMLQNLNLDLAALELESQAIVRALVSPELHSHQGLLIVDIGGTATNVVIHDHGTMRFTASLQHGAERLLADISVKDQNKIAYPRDKIIPEEEMDNLAVKMQPAQEELVIEIKGVVEFYNSIDAQHQVKEILLTGGGANLPGLDKVVLKYFDEVHVQRGNPWVNILPSSKVKKPPLSLKESVHFSTALGLALRRFNT